MTILLFSSFPDQIESSSQDELAVDKAHPNQVLEQVCLSASLILKLCSLSHYLLQQIFAKRICPYCVSILSPSALFHFFEYCTA